MVRPVTCEVFRQLRQMFPELPQHCDFVDIKLRIGDLPTISVGFYVNEVRHDGEEMQWKTFQVTDITPEPTQADADAAQPQTAASSSE